MMKVSNILILSLVLMSANFAVSAQSKIPTDAERETAAAAFTQNAVAPLVQNGIAAFTQKQNVAAITVMTKILTLDPVNQWALLYRGLRFTRIINTNAPKWT